MIYNANGSMTGSFNQAMQPKKVQGGSNVHSRPMTGYTNGNKSSGNSKKKQNVTMGSEQSFMQE
jgi:hypothetical protein